jgi:hypothetical protein
VPQVVEFEIEGQPTSVSGRDADRLARRLRAAGSADCVSAAEKIERATRLDEDTRVKLSIGEDECVLKALEELRETGDFLNPLARLERAIQSKIDREP